MKLETTTYGKVVDLPNTPFDAAVTATTDALKAEGFGILTDIDLSATLDKKLDAKIPRYLILGACHPPSAYQAVQAEPLVGLFLPCNVVVAEREGGGSQVAAIEPKAMFAMFASDAIEAVARDVEGRLHRALDALTSA